MREGTRPANVELSEMTFNVDEDYVETYEDEHGEPSMWELLGRVRNERRESEEGD